MVIKIQESMNSKTFVSGRIIKRYQIPLNEIDELNKTFDKNKKNLDSRGRLLAGRIDTELTVTDIVPKLKIMSTMEKNINDYMMSLNHFGITKSPQYNLRILTMWINDMQPHEYNPPHTHHDLTGWSTVLFLKVPNFINDVKHPHKFKDGKLGFFSRDTHCDFYECKVGDFYIFEASHQHFVMPYKTNDVDPVRRSMSFNFIIEDEDTNA